MKKILIALDYDDTSQKVAEVGFSMAQAMKAQAVLLHVVSEQPVYYSSYMFMTELRVDILEDLKGTTMDFLEKTKIHLGDPAIEALVKEGSIAPTILKTAEEINADIIVMGTHSRKWLESIIMGSQVESVLKKTTIPLFVIPTKKQE